MAFKFVFKLKEDVWLPGNKELNPERKRLDKIIPNPIEIYGDNINDAKERMKSKLGMTDENISHLYLSCVIETK